MSSFGPNTIYQCKLQLHHNRQDPSTCSWASSFQNMRQQISTAPNQDPKASLCSQAPSGLDPASLANHYSQLCASNISPHSTAPQLGPQQCLDLYSKGLTEAASLQQKSVKESTRKARITAVRELADWLHANATCKRSLLTATPEDLLVYFTQHWLPNHAGSSTAAGELIAAPSSLSGVKSHTWLQSLRC